MHDERHRLVAGFMSASTSRINSSLIPPYVAAALPALPSKAPMAAPVSGAANTRPARKPAPVQARMLVKAGNGFLKGRQTTLPRQREQRNKSLIIYFEKKAGVTAEPPATQYHVARFLSCACLE
jgi:hypothetical protein